MTAPLPATAFAACFRYRGKARPGSGWAAQFHLLPYHCLDVAAVGVEALRGMPALRSLPSRGLGLEGRTLDDWIAFWLTLHDLDFVVAGAGWEEVARLPVAVRPGRRAGGLWSYDSARGLVRPETPRAEAAGPLSVEGGELAEPRHAAMPAREMP